MRLVLYYPFKARIGHDVKEFIRFKSHSAYRKYLYFIPHFINNNQRDIAFFSPPVRKMSIKRKIIRFFVPIGWILINRIKFWKIKIIKRVSDLNPKTDVLLFFPFISMDKHELFENGEILQYDGLKIFHFTHYFDSTEKICSVLKNLPNTVIIGDGSLNKNILYQKFMKDQPFYVLPFVLKERYVSKVPFHQRKPKCLACGTKSRTCPHLHKNFIELFKSKYLHALRGEIFDKQQEITDVIDCLIFDYNELSDYQAKNAWEKILIYIKKHLGNDRTRFFSFDMVKKYNEYQLFVSPEEESGAPSINFIEGMACGCAYLGRADFYIDYGLIAHKHFIPYDGTLTDLMKQIQFYQKHPEITAEIANNGQKYVRDNFFPKKIADDFWNFLENAHKNL